MHLLTCHSRLEVARVDAAQAQITMRRAIGKNQGVAPEAGFDFAAAGDFWRLDELRFDRFGGNIVKLASWENARADETSVLFYYSEGLK